MGDINAKNTSNAFCRADADLALMEKHDFSGKR